VEDLAAFIERYDERPVLKSVVSELASLLDGDGGMSYRVSPLVSSWNVDFLFAARLPRSMLDRFSNFFERVPGRWAWFDPLRPEPSQRNRPIPFSSLTTWDEFDRSEVAAQIFGPSGLGRHEQFRVLVCDGPLLLAWVGVFTRKPIEPRDHLLFRRLVVPLRRRLTLERQLGLHSVYALAANAALDALPSAAFIVRADGGIEHANDVGRKLLAEERLDVAARMRHVAHGPGSARTSEDPSMVVTRLFAPGMPSYFVVVLREPVDDLEKRLAGLGARWQLTPKQRRVLREVVRGETNKGVAERLGLAESTIEYHVTALLRKARVDGRAALVAAFWSGRRPPGRAAVGIAPR
jgi:DNA-binding CsgD family transcriptional regulator